MTAYKYGKKIHIGDTSNYVPKSLEYIGESLNFPKTKINFNTCTYQELSDYCKNDVEICFKFIETLINFLIKYDLGGFKNTAASLALNCFKHNFYNKKEHPIFIHIFKDVIKAERNSFKGGITDLLKYGKFRNKLIKLDINSMYPYIMKNKELPYQFLCRDAENKIERVKDYLKKYAIIMECKIYLPKEYAYLLTRYKKDGENKNGFIYGEFNTTICSPEIEFVLKYGKILNIKYIDIYNKGYVFSEFVNFFYKKRIQFDKENNKAFSLLCKLFLNSLYGKFGEKRIFNEILECDNIEPKLYKMPKKVGSKQIIIQIGNKIIIKTPSEIENGFNAFVGIASFVTAYARMYLIEIMLKIGRKNCYYMDTDSIICNEKAIDKIKNYIDFNNEKTLGKLKIEGYSKESIFYRPKFYKFDNDLKCKGINISIKALKEGKTKILKDDDNILRVKQEQFERFKTSFRKESLNCVRIINIDKEMDKYYNKGKIMPNHDIRPFNANELNVSPELNL